MLVLIDYQDTIEWIAGGEPLENIEEVAEKYADALARLTGFTVEFGETAGEGVRLVPQTDAELDVAHIVVDNAMALLAQDWTWAG